MTMSIYLDMSIYLVHDTPNITPNLNECVRTYHKINLPCRNYM